MRKVLFPEGRIPAGLDIVVVNGVADTPLFGYTVEASDVLGYEKRDFLISYQDPTITIGPRLGRVLVNLAMNRPNGTMLDPFCGLGTILQEGLMTGRNIVGVDISRNIVNRTRYESGLDQGKLPIYTKIGYQIDPRPTR